MWVAICFLIFNPSTVLLSLDSYICSANIVFPNFFNFALPLCSFPVRLIVIAWRKAAVSCTQAEISQQVCNRQHLDSICSDCL